MGPKIKMSSLEDSDSDIQQQIPGAVLVPGGDNQHDLGTHELANTKGLKWLIQSNVDQAGTFIGRINAAEATAKNSIDLLEQKYGKMAEELERKVE